MTDTLYCIRGCTRWDHHLTDCDATDDNPCKGCEPRQVETGYLCPSCLGKLSTLLGPPEDRESVAGASQWLADNLGQHIRHSMGGKPAGDGSTHGEHMVTVMAVMSDLQIALAEMAEDFTNSRRMRLGTDHDPAAVAARLRPWLTTLADWEHIGDHIDALTKWMRQAHAVCPWRGKDPDAHLSVAATLYLAPTEPTDAICDRFKVAPQWLKDARRRHGLEPERDGVRPLWWRPWDVYAILHPETARRYEADMAKREQEQQLATTGNQVAWTSDIRESA